MTRTPWSPRYAWHRRPGGKYDGYGRDYFLPDENGQTGKEAYLSATPRREQVARWLREERSAMLRATPLDVLTDQLAWRIVGGKSDSAEGWTVKPELLELMRERTLNLRADYYDAMGTEEAQAATDGREPDPRAWAEEQAEVETLDAALEVLAGARNLPDDVPERHRHTIASIAFDVADVLREDVAARHGEPSDAKLARHANAVGILHDSNNRLQRRRDARTLRWAIEDYFATLPARRARSRRSAYRTLVFSRKHTPKWLRSATTGSNFVYPDAGLPQLWQISEYVDWPSLLRRHSAEICADDYDWPTTLALDIVEDSRARGHDAAADVELWVNNHRDKPVFSLSVLSIAIHDELPMADADRYTDQLRAAWATHADDAAWGDLAFEENQHALHDLQASTTPLSTLLANRGPVSAPHQTSDYRAWIFAS